jgi:hypothetical protein
MENIKRCGSITVLCKQCGQSFKENPCRIRNGRGKFCSKNCSSKSKVGISYPQAYKFPAGPANPNWKGIRIPKPCPVCGEFFVSGNKTCSSECGHKLVGLQLRGTYHSEETRKRRSESLKSYRKSHPEFMRGKNNPYARKHPNQKRICLRCGKTYERQQSQGTCLGAGKFYCSNDCRVRSQRKSINQVSIADRIEDLTGEKPELEKTWPWLRSPISNQRLRVDIYLPIRNLAIEYHGRQHFDPKGFSHSRGSFEKIQIRDKAKIELLKTHNIPLVILSGWPVSDQKILTVITPLPKLHLDKLFDPASSPLLLGRIRTQGRSPHLSEGQG